MKRNWTIWSLILLFTYYGLDRWIPLGRWNGEYGWPVHNEQAVLDIVVAGLLLGVIFSFRSKFRPGMVLGTALLGLWAYFHLRTWWIPYFQGVTKPQQFAFYERFLVHTQLLPRYGPHLPPDGEHIGIDLFVFPAFFLCLIATVRNLGMRAASKARAASHKPVE